MKELKVDNIYDVYEVYASLYSREPSWKMAEAHGLSFAMACLAAHSKKQLMQSRPAVNFEQDGFTMMEICSGRGEHYKHISLPQPLAVKAYYHQDIRDHSASTPNFIQGDCFTAEFDPALGINLIFAPFFTVSSIHDDGHRHTRQQLLKLFQNMHRNLPPGGGFFCDFASDGYNTSLSVEAADEEPYIENILPSSPLRAAFDIPYHVKCTLEVQRKYSYDRLRCTGIDEFVGPLIVTAGSKTVASITIKEPMTQRYFSETELVDLALEAGFRDIQFFSLDYSESGFIQLDRVILPEEDIEEDDIDGYQPNAMMFIA